MGGNWKRRNITSKKERRFSSFPRKLLGSKKGQEDFFMGSQNLKKSEKGPGGKPSENTGRIRHLDGGRVQRKESPGLIGFERLGGGSLKTEKD